MFSPELRTIFFLLGYTAGVFRGFSPRRGSAVFFVVFFGGLDFSFAYSGLIFSETLEEHPLLRF